MGKDKSAEVFTVLHRVTAEHRVQRNRHRGGILWFTGLSASGKSTLAVELERVLFERGCQVFMLDGDNVRQGLSADLGGSPEDRADRDRIRERHPQLFHEVYLDAPVEVCEKRDSKGLYRRARAGEVKEFTDVSAPYEPPLAPTLVISTGSQNVAQSLARLVAYVEERLLDGRAVSV